MIRWRAILAVMMADEAPRLRSRISAHHVVLGTLFSMAVGSVIADLIGERKRIEQVRRDTLADLTAKADDIASRRDNMIASEANARTDGQW